MGRKKTAYPPAKRIYGPYFLTISREKFAPASAQRSDVDLRLHAQDLLVLFQNRADHFGQETLYLMNAAAHIFGYD